MGDKATKAELAERRRRMAAKAGGRPGKAIAGVPDGPAAGQPTETGPIAGGASGASSGAIGAGNASMPEDSDYAASSSGDSSTGASSGDSSSTGASSGPSTSPSSRGISSGPSTSPSIGSPRDIPFSGRGGVNGSRRGVAAPASAAKPNAANAEPKAIGSIILFPGAGVYLGWIGHKPAYLTGIDAETGDPVVHVFRDRTQNSKRTRSLRKKAAAVAGKLLALAAERMSKEGVSVPDPAQPGGGGDLQDGERAARVFLDALCRAVTKEIERVAADFCEGGGEGAESRAAIFAAAGGFDPSWSWIPAGYQPLPPSKPHISEGVSLAAASDSDSDSESSSDSDESDGSGKNGGDAIPGASIGKPAGYTGLPGDRGQAMPDPALAIPLDERYTLAGENPDADATGEFLTEAAKRAVKQRWPVRPEVKVALVSGLEKVLIRELEQPDQIDAKVMINLARAFGNFERQNQIDEIRATPQLVLHANAGRRLSTSDSAASLISAVLAELGRRAVVESGARGGGAADTGGNAGGAVDGSRVVESGAGNGAAAAGR